MVLTHPLFCPVRIVQGYSYDEALRSIVGRRSWALMTSASWPSRGVVDRITAQCGKPQSVVAEIESNPTVRDIIYLSDKIDDLNVIVALGGGSVLDAAKGVAAFNGVGRSEDILMSHLRDGEALPDNMAPAEIIAVPTTSGTGSEVTRWGTIWGDDAVKHSVTDFKLFPSFAILDPELCTSMSKDLTLATGLDALSHAMESVWNRRHTDATDTLAKTSIEMIRELLPAVLKNPGNVGLRQKMQTASMIAGLAMSTTQTALAHSISYPFTARYGMPHGIACSFTLAEVARFNAITEAERLKPIATGMGCSVDALPVELEALLRDLGVGQEIARYVTPAVTDELGENLITRARAANNIRAIDGPMARELARLALDCLYPTTANSALASPQAFREAS